MVIWNIPVERKNVDWLIRLLSRWKANTSPCEFKTSGSDPWPQPPGNEGHIKMNASNRSLSLLSSNISDKSIQIMHRKIVQDLVDYFEEHTDVQDAFKEAFDKASSFDIMRKFNIRTLDDYLAFYDSMLVWTPSEDFSATQVYGHLCVFYYVLDLPPMLNHQVPGLTSEGHTWLSDWLVKYAKELGNFMDTPESISEETTGSFYGAAAYHMEDYPIPPGGWRTFNEFFARKINPDVRPIAAPGDHNVIVSPADCYYSGSFPIDESGEIVVKGIPWKITELLKDEDYGETFAEGKFTHCYLTPYDYHRQHAPVEGRIIQAKVIPGICYLGVTVQLERGVPTIVPRRRLNPDLASGDETDSRGYQIMQTRGMILIENPVLGIVGVLIIGMAQASSVILSVQTGDYVNKGQEIAYFQMGGSDVIMVFQKSAADTITFPKPTSPPAQFKMGSWFATSSA
ncbi:hypothetical protein D9613_009795 [Agrocybe pediades]|uniref:Phosphatidylserine decarboxylase n=1 Tax=Agrocybe pediades TaxID=84607 RepID=A0A8H4QXA3_9AGAR|nr:hypothetical protein D9613_009795 [Agrocybe pediades]